MIKKLSAMPYAQAHIEINGDEICLFSYVTLVAKLVKSEDETWLSVYGLYSMTTRKHISAFLKEYCPDISFQVAKVCCEQGRKICIETAEIKPITE